MDKKRDARSAFEQSVWEKENEWMLRAALDAAIEAENEVLKEISQ